MDEKSAIQALDPLDRRLPLSPGRAERHFEYYRHGTLSLYAALNPQTGEVIGQTASRHTSKEFVLGGHLKTGHQWTRQNRPTEASQDKSIYTV